MPLRHHFFWDFWEMCVCLWLICSLFNTFSKEISIILGEKWVDPDLEPDLRDPKVTDPGVSGCGTLQNWNDNGTHDVDCARHTHLRGLRLWLWERNLGEAEVGLGLLPPLLNITILRKNHCSEPDPRGNDLTWPSWIRINIGNQDPDLGEENGINNVKYFEISVFVQRWPSCRRAGGFPGTIRCPTWKSDKQNHAIFERKKKFD